MRTIGSWPSLAIIASPAGPDSKMSSMIRSRPAPWTSIRSWTSSRAATLATIAGRLVKFADQRAELPDLLLKFFFACHATPS